MKKVTAFLLALCMLTALAACGNSQSSNSRQEQINSLEHQESTKDIDNKDAVENTGYIKDKVVMSEKVLTTLSPWGTGTGSSAHYEVYETLYRLDNKNEMYPLLADATYNGSYMPGCDHDSGSGVYTVHIYDYIKDHKGRAITAEDVAWCYTHQLNNETTSGWGNLVSIEAEGDTTVVFTFSEEMSGIDGLVNIFPRCFIMSKQSYDESSSGMSNEMCGTGPYKFVSFVSGSTLVIERNEDYWQTNEDILRQEQRANVWTIEYDFQDESAQKILALKTGAVDIVTDILATDAVDFADGGEYADRFNVYTYTSQFIYFMLPNCSSSSQCNDINLRLAIFNAIDLKGLEAGLGGSTTRLNAFATPIYSDYDMVDWAGIESYNNRDSVDAALVQQYLDQSSYNGEKLTLLCNSTTSAAAELISAQLAAHNINVKVSNLDQSSYQSAIADENTWDLMMGITAGTYNVITWQHCVSFTMTGAGDHSQNFVYDREWDDLMNLCCTTTGHTAENMQKWWEMTTQNAYAMALYQTGNYIVIPEDMTYVCQGDKLMMLPGACTYAES